MQQILDISSEMNSLVLSWGTAKEGEKKEEDVKILCINLLLLLLLLAKILCINGLASLQPHSLTRTGGRTRVVILITTHNQEWSWPTGGCSLSQQWPSSCKVCGGGGSQGAQCGWWTRFSRWSWFKSGDQGGQSWQYGKYGVEIKMVTVVKGSEEHYSFSQSEGFFSLLLVRPFSLKDGRSRKIISIQQFSKLIFFWLSWLHIQDM